MIELENLLKNSILLMHIKCTARDGYHAYCNRCILAFNYDYTYILWLDQNTYLYLIVEPKLYPMARSKIES